MEIHPVWGRPIEDVSCPGCGKVYGHDGTTVCTQCEECSSCCKERRCPTPTTITADEFVESLP